MMLSLLKNTRKLVLLSLICSKLPEQFQWLVFRMTWKTLTLKKFLFFMLSIFLTQANAEGSKRKLSLVPGSMVLWFNNFLIIFNLISVYCGQIICFVRTWVLCILIRKNLAKHFFTSKLDTQTSYYPILCKLNYGIFMSDHSKDKTASVVL